MCLFFVWVRNIFYAYEQRPGDVSVTTLQMKRIAKGILILVLGLNIGCSGDQNIRQIDVADDVVLHLLPSLSPFGSGLNFLFQSDSIYDCQNVGFVYTMRSSSGGMNIHILGVHIPATCVGGTAPAFEKVIVPAKAGNYTVAIDIGDYIHNTGSLVIDSNTYSLNMHSLDGMSVPNETMYQIPEGTIWGYVVASDGTLQDEAMSLVRNGFKPITDDVDLTAGYYGYFSVTKPFGLYTQYPVYHTEHSCFTFHFTQDHSILESTIQEIKSQLPSNTDFKVFTWEGEEL